MRIYFDLIDRTDVIRDKDGLEVADASDLRQTITRAVAELMREFSADDRRGWQLQVKDEDGDVLFTIPLG